MKLGINVMPLQQLWAIFQSGTWTYLFHSDHTLESFLPNILRLKTVSKLRLWSAAFWHYVWL